MMIPLHKKAGAPYKEHSCLSEIPQPPLVTYIIPKIFLQFVKKRYGEKSKQNKHIVRICLLHKLYNFSRFYKVVG